MSETKSDWRPGRLVMLGAATVILFGCQGSEQPADVAVTAAAPVAAPINYSVDVTDAPKFETQGHWSDGYKKAVGNGEGAVVGPGGGNENVFAQTFKAKPGEPFKVLAKAASVNAPTAAGRFQINWHSAEGNFLSVWSQTFDVTSDLKSFEAELVAPVGAESGSLYVVGDGNSVVRYVEMRLLGQEGRAQ